MEYPEHNEPLPIVSILEDIARIKNTKDDLPIFRPRLIWPTKFRKLRQQLNLLQDGGSNDWSQAGMLICKKCGEAIEIGKRCSRPLDL